MSDRKTIEAMLDGAIYFLRKWDPEITPAAVYDLFEDVIKERRQEGCSLLPAHLMRKERRQKKGE